MKTTLNLRDDLLKKARELTGLKEKTALVHLGLETLIQKFVRDRLIQLGGVDRRAVASVRRKRKF